MVFYEHPNISLASIKAAKLKLQQEELENKKIKPTFKFPPYLYSLRVDLFHKKESETLLLTWIKKYNAKKYLCARELKKDKTPHYQCAIWFDQQPNGNNARNFWRGKTISDKNGHSFKIARKPESLAKYCNDKEKYGLLTNLTKDEILQVGTWKNKKEDTRRFNEKLDQFLEKLSKEENTEPYQCTNLETIITRITDFCYENERHGLTNHHMLNVLRKHNLIGTQLYSRMKYPILKYLENSINY